MVVLAAARSRLTRGLRVCSRCATMGYMDQQHQSTGFEVPLTAVSAGAVHRIETPREPSRRNRLMIFLWILVALALLFNLLIWGGIGLVWYAVST